VLRSVYTKLLNLAALTFVFLAFLFGRSLKQLDLLGGLACCPITPVHLRQAVMGLVRQRRGSTAFWNAVIAPGKSWRSERRIA